MRFWSKGLGEKTIELHLSKGEPLKSSGKLYLKGQMEAPVSWEYIMPLTGEDIEDFLALLKDPAVAEYIYRSPHRWRLYAGLVMGGLQLAGSVIGQLMRRALGRIEPEADVVIQVPPPTERKRNRAVRRRLGSKKTAAPNLRSPGEEDDEVQALSAGGI